MVIIQIQIFMMVKCSCISIMIIDLVSKRIKTVTTGVFRRMLMQNKRVKNKQNHH